MKDFSKIAVLISLVGLLLVATAFGPRFDTGAVRELLGNALPWLLLAFLFLRFRGGCSSRCRPAKQQAAD
jgi:hypothetical protein